jgi:hypothetical protein
MPGGAAVIIASLAAGGKGLAAGAALVITIGRHGARHRTGADEIDIGRELDRVSSESGDNQEARCTDRYPLSSSSQPQPSLSTEGGQQSHV